MNAVVTEEEKVIPRPKRGNTLQHTYFLEGNFREATSQEMFFHLRNVLKHLRFKIDTLETGGFKIRTSEVIYKKTLDLMNYETFFFEANEDKENPNELVFYICIICIRVYSTMKRQ